MTDIIKSDYVTIVSVAEQGPAGPPGVAANTAAAYILGLAATGLPNSTVLQGGNGLLVTNSGGILTISATGAGSGTVTSVAIATPADLFTTSAAITTAGTITLTKVNQTGNVIYASPANGTSGVPTFRNISANDIAALFTPGSNISIVGGSTLTLSATGLASQYASGTVTSVGSSNLNAFASVSVATPTTTPVLNFTLTNPGAGQFFGAPASGSGVPGYRNLVLGDLPPGSYTVNSSSILNNLASGNGTGFLAQAGSLVAWRTLQGTSNRLTISNANGSGVPVFDVGSDVYTKSYSNVLNNLASGVPTAGQVLIGNSLGTYTLASISAGPGVQVNSGSGFINIAASGYTAGTGISISASNVISSTATGGGTVTSVSSLSPIFTTSNATTTPTFTLSNVASGAFLAGPVVGASAPPTYRALVLTDLPPGTFTTSTTGDVTITGNISAIGVNKVTSAMLRQGIAKSVIGVTGNATANEADIQASGANQVLASDTGNTSITFRSLASGDFGANLLDVTHGGTGSSVIPTDGQIPIGSTSGQTYVPATITQGTGITIVNGPGTITISSTASGGGGGGISYTWSTLSGSATATANTKYSVDCSGGSFTHYFPSGTPADGSLIGYKLKAVGSNPSQTFTIQPYTTIDGSSAALTSNRVNDYFQFEYSAAFGGWLQTS